MVEKEEETMGSCSNRYSDEMMMLKASVEKDKKERSRHRSSSTVSSRSVLRFDNANNLSKVWEHTKIKEQVKK